MYEVLLEMAKASIQAMRTERSMPVVEESIEQLDPPPAPPVNEPESLRFTTEDLKKQLDTKPSASAPLTVPKAPKV
jgi:hypothetical protein